MSHEIIPDAGPSVALLNAGDPHHDRVCALCGMIESPLLISEAVVTEVCFLAQHLAHRGQEKVLELVRHGALNLLFPRANQIDRIAQLAVTHRGVVVFLADLCLAYMSELPQSDPSPSPQLHDLPQESAAADSSLVPESLFARINLRRMS